MIFDFVNESDEVIVSVKVSVVLRHRKGKKECVKSTLTLNLFFYDYSLCRRQTNENLFLRLFQNINCLKMVNANKDFLIFFQSFCNFFRPLSILVEK